MSTRGSGGGLLEVVVLHPRDAEAAEAGGADRLHVCAVAAGEGRPGDQARSVEPAALSAVVRATELPVRATVRLSEGLTTQGGELARLQGLASEYLSLGADGLVFGFLTPELDVDVEVCEALAESLPGACWTFDRTIDHALDARVAWRQARDLPGLDTIHTAGSLSGLRSGFDDLARLAQADPEFAGMAMAAGAVPAEDVPWLVRSGVRRLQLGSAARPGGSFAKSSVDAGFVRSWRLLLDAALGRESTRLGSAG